MVDDVIIPNIEKELTKLKEEGQKKGEIKACLFNLVIYSEDKLRHEYLKEIALGIKESFPCRVISIDCDNDSKKPFLNVTTAQEVFDKETTVISCDRIDIKCSHDYKERVSFLVIPHLVPDLPVYLLWPIAPDLDDLILSKLIPYATKLIFDSDSASDLKDFSKKMLSNKLLENVAVTDMNWASLTSWREILLQVFDNEQKIEKLSCAKEIKICYNSLKSDDYQYTERRAVYLQGWLAAQLKWEYVKSNYSQDEYRIYYNTKNNNEICIIISGNLIKDLIPGSIIGIEVFGQNNALCFLKREGNAPFVKAHISEMDVCKMPFTLPLKHYKKGFPLMKEMLFGTCSPHYWNMLNILKSLQISC